MKRLLIIFVKNPVKGKVKSRLAAKIGPDKALTVYRKLLERTRSVVSSISCHKLVCYSNEVEQNDIWTEGGFLKDLQEGEDLGKKMYNAIIKAAAAGYRKICLIGSDNMEISPSIILDAFEKLDSADIVIGPSRDGGYYLIGMKKPHVELFSISSWSTPTVLKETMSKASRMSLRWHLLEELNDVDELEDIRDEDRDYLLN